MVDEYYVKGGSNFNTGVNAQVWVAVHTTGYTSGDYIDTGWKTVDVSGSTNDPHWLLSGGAAPYAEFGLYGGTRIKCTSGNLYGWSSYSGAFVNLFDKTTAGDLSHDDLISVDPNDHHIPTAIMDTATDAKTTTGISSNWAFDHDADASAHHAKYTDGEVETIITAELVNGQSIDNAIDALILTHKNVATAHHTATVAGDLNHNDLANLNAGTDYEHITQTQKDALHAIYTDGEVDAIVAVHTAIATAHHDPSGYETMSGTWSDDWISVSGMAASATGGAGTTHITGLTGDNWSVPYANGIYMTGLDLGASGLFLSSAGPTTAPVWAAGGIGYDERPSKLFYGTYSFQWDNNGAEPDGFVVTDGAGCATTVIHSIGGHVKVVKMNDGGAGTRCLVEQIFVDGAQTAGTYEVWVRGSDVTADFLIGLYDGVNIRVAIGFYQDFFRYNFDYDAGSAISDDTWHHIKLTFDCVADTYNVWLDGNLEATGEAFISVSTDIDRIKFLTAAATANFIYYIDALGYSWDSNYDVGDDEKQIHYLIEEV